MSLANRSDLITAVANRLERDEDEQLMGDFIALAEARMNRELRLEQMLKRKTATITGEFRARPDDFAAPRSMRLTGGTRRLLAFVTPEQMADLKEANPGLSGEPHSYALSPGGFEFFPVPSGEHPIALTYYARIPPLSETPTNWLLTEHPDIYLWGAVLEGALHLFEGDLAAAAKAMFEEAKARLSEASVRDSLSANLTPQPSGFAV